MVRQCRDEKEQIAALEKDIRHTADHLRRISDAFLAELESKQQRIQIADTKDALFLQDVPYPYDLLKTTAEKLEALDELRKQHTQTCNELTNQGFPN